MRVLHSGALNVAHLPPYTASHGNFRPINRRSWASSILLSAASESAAQSQDRLWSIMPWLYTWYWFAASCSHGFNPRLFIMAVLASSLAPLGRITTAKQERLDCSCLVSVSLRARNSSCGVGQGIWGFRLTYNFWVKGGFSGGEEHSYQAQLFVDMSRDSLSRASPSPTAFFQLRA